MVSALVEKRLQSPASHGYRVREHGCQAGLTVSLEPPEAELERAVRPWHSLTHGFPGNLLSLLNSHLC